MEVYIARDGIAYGVFCDVAREIMREQKGTSKDSPVACGRLDCLCSVEIERVERPAPQAQ